MLAALEKRWIELFAEFRGDDANLAAPFLSVKCSSEPSILYVGKATAGCWRKKSFLAETSVRERKNVTADFIRDEVVAQRYISVFWRFAFALSGSTALENLTWTNLLKLGVLVGNPTGAFAGVQRALAVETLLTEIDEYRPKLVVIATGGFEAKLVESIFGEASSFDRNKKFNAWWKVAGNGLPAVVWTGHPERKSLETLEVWRRKAAEFL